MKPPLLVPPPAPVGPPRLGTPAVPGGPVYLLPAWLLNWFRPPPPPPPAPTPGPNPPPSAESARVVAALNDQRGARGLPALAYDARLSGPAQYWAAEGEAGPNTLTHGPPGSFAVRVRTEYPRAGLDPGTLVGEIVAGGYQDVPSVVAGWIHSPPHRAIVLGDFTRAGAGVAYAADGTRYDCVDFMKN